ncbi:MAG: Uma2 family endonuclease [Lachnospiraceae bacterium]|nr:Uma2 family endonuclease [Lachnospiraceae bacterium]MBO5144055.1 Uma2 family endonuclease [Lachnospiraceae bacterium]
MPLPQEKHYTVEDFYSMPEDIRAELINGHIVCMSAPGRLHQELSHELDFAITNYIKSKSGKCRVYTAPFSVQLRKEEDTVVEPDISVICDLDKLNDRGCLGAPDWIIEIASPSNPSHDYITKLGLYHDAGVREYWIVDAEQRKIHVYNMHDGKFILNTYTFDDTVQVSIYEDLYIGFPSLDLNI